MKYKNRYAEDYFLTKWVQSFCKIRYKASQTRTKPWEEGAKVEKLRTSLIMNRGVLELCFCESLVPKFGLDFLISWRKTSQGHHWNYSLHGSLACLSCRFLKRCQKTLWFLQSLLPMAIKERTALLTLILRGQKNSRDEGITHFFYSKFHGFPCIINTFRYKMQKNASSWPEFHFSLLFLMLFNSSSKKLCWKQNFFPWLPFFAKYVYVWGGFWVLEGIN